MPTRYTTLPVLGRLTGRGNTANVEIVLKADPDIILDYGSISKTYKSLADRVQDRVVLPPSVPLVSHAYSSLEAVPHHAFGGPRIF
jgi:ABC-type Fe3+-hydroxamate transport system substrate-binding protein